MTSYGDLTWKDPFQMIRKEVVVANSKVGCIQGFALRGKE